MSLQELNRFAPRADTEAESLYPAVLHFRIIVEEQACEEAKLSAAVAGYCVKAPLAAARQSSGGRYQDYSLSVLLASRDEQAALVEGIKKVPGVRLVL